MEARKRAKQLSKKAQARLDRDKQIYASGILRGIDEVKKIVCEMYNDKMTDDELFSKLKLERNKQNVTIFQPGDGFEA